MGGGGDGVGSAGMAGIGHDLPFSSQAERLFGWPLCPETGHPIDAINSESTHGSTWVNRSQIST